MVKAGKQMVSSPTVYLVPFEMFPQRLSHALSVQPRNDSVTLMHPKVSTAPNVTSVHYKRRRWKFADNVRGAR